MSVPAVAGHGGWQSRRVAPPVCLSLRLRRRRRPCRPRRGGCRRRGRHVDAARVAGVRDPASARRRRAAVPRPRRPEPQPPRRAGVRGRRRARAAAARSSSHSCSHCTPRSRSATATRGTSRRSTSRTSRSAASRRGSPSSRSARRAISASRCPAWSRPASSSSSTMSCSPSCCGSAAGTASAKPGFFSASGLGIEFVIACSRRRGRRVRHASTRGSSPSCSRRSRSHTARSRPPRCCARPRSASERCSSRPPTATMLFGVGGEIMTANRSALSLLGYEHDEALLTHADDDPPPGRRRGRPAPVSRS